MITLHLDESGQLLIPAEFLAQLNLAPGTAVQIQVADDSLEIKRSAPSSRGSDLIAAMRGRATQNLSTDPILSHTRERIP